MAALTTIALLALLTVLATTRAQDELYLDSTADIEARVQDLMDRMDLQDKIGQMILDAENTFELAPNIGSYLVGASDPPEGNTPSIWRKRFNFLENYNNQRFGIPLIFGTDAIHGNNIIKGATIFPHNIGLGATKNQTLIKEIAQVTAEEMTTSGLDLTFAPTLAVGRDIRWGRTYESYSENTELVASYARAFITGLQGESPPFKVIATAKHWVGDGGTTGGIDAGDTALSDDDLRKIHAAPYIEAIDAGVGSIMVSFSSVNGIPMHAHKELIENVLKGEMGFDGFVMSDWEGYLKNSGDYAQQVITAVNAGIDMIMGPYHAYFIMLIIKNAVESGLVSRSRVHDAAERIVRTKFRAGLFEKKVGPLDENNFTPLGIPAHRAVSRQAVRESLVLLQNYGALPLQKNARILLAGKSVDNIRNQCGGWTMSWQGTSEDVRHLIVGGTTILAGIQALSEGTITYSPDGGDYNPDLFDVAVLVVGETPYAEFEGDRNDLSLDAEDRAEIEALKQTGIPIVLVLVSGRPMIITDILEDVDAVVAAWLPGTEGDGVAQVLFGDFDFSGTLSFTWPRNMGQLDSGFVGDNPNALFKYGYGLNYANGPQQRSSEPTQSPTTAPTTLPTTLPTTSPTKIPVATPTGSPTISPTKSITGAPTKVRGSLETRHPSESPVESPDNGDGSNDEEAPTQPKTLKLTDSSFKAISFEWEPATDNVGVDQYLVYDSNNLLQTTSETNAIVANLEQGTQHSFTVSAMDAAGNEGPHSQPLLVSTTVLVDAFVDQDTLASNGWGEWRVSYGGTVGDGFAALQVDVPGYEDSAAQMLFSVDTGDWGFANIFLDFNEGKSIDLTTTEATGVRFRIRGEPGANFNIQLGTPLAEWNWMYFQYPFQTSVEWTQFVLLFDQDFQPSSASIPYTIDDVLKNITSIVWETTGVEMSGWIMIDEVEFMTTTSTPENSDGPDGGRLSSAPSSVDGPSSPPSLQSGGPTSAPLSSDTGLSSAPSPNDEEPSSAPSTNDGGLGSAPNPINVGSSGASASSIFVMAKPLIPVVACFVCCFCSGWC